MEDFGKKSIHNGEVQYEYLSDYASGYIRTGEKDTEFMINTVTGAVYFGTDPDTQAKLNEAAQAYIQEITEGADPAEYDLDAIKKQLKEEHGLQFGRLRIVG